MPKLLLLEDDSSLVDGLTYSLKKNGFELKVAGNIREAERLTIEQQEEFDLFLFDVTLPDGNGFALCEKLRARGNQTPILFLTASDEETSIIRGLDCGGDDYMTKPFRFGELCSRIRALLRRSSQGKNSEEGILYTGEVTVKLAEGRVYLGGQNVELTGAEFRLLCLLIQNSGRILTREMLLDRLWDGAGNFVDDNTLSVYVRRLREKLERDPSQPKHIRTIRGLGYKWEE